MFNVQSTQRVKRIARDLQGVLAVLGRPLGYSACLEMSARMLGHPSYGMLVRRAGGSVPTLDDAEVSTVEAASRRAHHASILLQAGLPYDLHDAILTKVRPTARSRARTALDLSGYGCAWFDGDDAAGWACVAGGEPFRFSNSAELDPGITWWTTLYYQQRYRTGSYPSNILNDKHLTLSPKSALQEHDLDMSESGGAKAAAGFGAQVLARARKVSDACVSGESHKSLVQAFEVGWKRDHGTDDWMGKPVTVWEEFIATSLRGHRGAPIEIMRMPRLEYARAMMDTQVPTGPYDFVDLTRIPVTEMRMRYVRDNPDVAFVHVHPPKDLAPRCPIRGAIWHLRSEPGWLAKPLYEMLAASIDMTPDAVMLAPGFRRAGDFLPEAASRFLAEADTASWADGIVAEAIWRSGLSSPRQGLGSWQYSFAGNYMRAVDHARMCGEAVKLYAEGKSISSFGLGWVRYTQRAS